MVPNGPWWVAIDPKSMWVGSRKRAAKFNPAEVHPPTDFWGFCLGRTQSRTTAVVCVGNHDGTEQGATLVCRGGLA
jgi:hypothetical protein